MVVMSAMATATSSGLLWDDGQLEFASHTAQTHKGKSDDVGECWGELINPVAFFRLSKRTMLLKSPNTNPDSSLLLRRRFASSCSLGQEDDRVCSDKDDFGKCRQPKLDILGGAPWSRAAQVSVPQRERLLASLSVAQRRGALLLVL